MAHSRKTRNSRNNKSEQSRADRKINRSLPPNNKYSKKSKAFITLFGFASVFFIILFLRGRNVQPKPRMLEAEVVLKFADLIRGFTEQQERLLAILKEEPVKDMIKQKLRPVQEKVASLRAQITFYEKAEKIPGGPQKFMQTALKELEELRAAVASDLDTELFTILKEYKERKNAGLMQALETEALSREFVQIPVDPVHNVTILLLRSIGIETVADTIENFEENMDDTIAELSVSNARLENSTFLTELSISAQEVAALYDELAFLLEERHVVAEKIAKASEKMGVDLQELEFEGEETMALFAELGSRPGIAEHLEEYAKLHNKILSETEANKDLLEYMPNWLIQAQLVVLSIMTKLEESENDSREQARPFVELRNMIVTDIARLRTRVQNLEHEYVKRAPLMVQVDL